MNGPKEVLDKTEHCQIAVVVASLAAVEVLWEMDEDAVKNCVATAGYKFFVLGISIVDFYPVFRIENYSIAIFN